MSTLTRVQRGYGGTRIGARHPDGGAHERGLRNFETRSCDAGALPFADAIFDAVLCRLGFTFFPDVASAAREFARVAKPGARVCAAVRTRLLGNQSFTRVP